jgi:hypothetical protein
LLKNGVAFIVILRISEKPEEKRFVPDILQQNDGKAMFSHNASLVAGCKWFYCVRIL